MAGFGSKKIRPVPVGYVRRIPNKLNHLEVRHEKKANRNGSSGSRTEIPCCVGIYRDPLEICAQRPHRYVDRLIRFSNLGAERTIPYNVKVANLCRSFKSCRG